MGDSMPLTERLQILQSLGPQVMDRSLLDSRIQASNHARYGLADQEQIIKQARAKMEPFLGPRTTNANVTANNPTKLGPTHSDPSFNLAQRLSEMDFSEYATLEIGQLAPKEITFAATKLVTMYPQWYVGKANRPVALPYFEKEKMRGALWDLYVLLNLPCPGRASMRGLRLGLTSLSFYIYNPKDTTHPITVVPTDQVERYLNLVNAKAGLGLTIPGGKAGKKFKVSFDIAGQPRPRYLGRSRNIDEFGTLVHNIPHFSDRDALNEASHLGAKDFNETLNLLKLGGESVESKEKAAAERAAKRMSNLAQAMLEAQKLLGLKNDNDSPVFDSDTPPPFPPDGNAILLAIDIEVMENSSTVVTEVGLALLDTNSIVGVPPGKGAKNWHSSIHYRHLRINEYRQFRNYKFVLGCPDKFNFGESEFPPRAEAAKLIENIFFGYSDLGRDGVSIPGREFRDIIIVGHAVQSDMQYLNKMGVNPMAAQNFLKNVDTKDLHQHWTRSSNGRKLDYVLDDLEISHSYLHNAGNDAAYTLQAMLALAVNDAAGCKPSISQVEDPQ